MGSTLHAVSTCRSGACCTSLDMLTMVVVVVIVWERVWSMSQTLSLKSTVFVTVEVVVW